MNQGSVFPGHPYIKAQSHTVCHVLRQLPLLGVQVISFKTVHTDTENVSMKAKSASILPKCNVYDTGTTQASKLGLMYLKPDWIVCTAQ